MQPPPGGGRQNRGTRRGPSIRLADPGAVRPLPRLPSDLLGGDALRPDAGGTRSGGCHEEGELPMRVSFMGTPAFALPSLKALIAAGHDICLVVTQPDRPAGRGRVPTPPPIKLAAVEFGLPLLQPEKVGESAAVAALETAKPDVIVVVAYGQLLPRR